MGLIYTILFGFTLGFFVKQRGVAIVGFIAGYAWVFSYQSLELLLEMLGGKTGEAFGADMPITLPVRYRDSDVAAYGIVNLVFMLVGVGLVVLGGYVAARRAAKKSAVSVA
ncbi:MAG: hypothetical protein QM714_10905 [Nocardioides sp.]|uniref:hypothetical protein n=1 Tax=Nocardioides sp. TaxID=35761 RepID=UPI0039E4284F